jgi:soluble lytic murein transglycosylase-like protein
VRFLAILVFGASAFAGEYAVLSTGFKIHAESHVTEGNIVRLKSDKGLIELPVSQVQGFEVEEYTAPSPPPASRPGPSDTIKPAEAVDPKLLLATAAKEAGLPPALVQLVAKAESGFRQDAVSPKGAIGLMQLMPETAAHLDANPYDPKQNVEAGVRYLRDLLIKYQDDPHQVTKALAAYNAGPGAVDKYRGIPPYRETINYVEKIVKQYLKAQNSNE